MPSLSSNGAAAQSYLMSTPAYYGLVNLALASYAYTDGHSPCYASPPAQPNQVAVVKDIQDAIAALPALPMPPGSSSSTLPGSWSVVWGPCYSSDYSNLMYVATYNDANSTPANAPVFAAVCIRGTDVNLGSGDAAGLLNQFFQDLHANTLVDWSNAGSGSCTPVVLPLEKNPRIASGTCTGLNNKLLQLAPQPPLPSGTTIVPFLKGLLAQNPGLPIVVTGHSLGGCQTTVMAASLLQSLGVPAKQIIPTPFAPPTAGNEYFATTPSKNYPNSVLGQFPGLNAWVNNLDLVPMAYGNVGGISNLWQTYYFSNGATPPQPTTTKGPAIPSDLQYIYDGILAISKLGYHYTQPANVTQLQNWASPLLPSLADMQTFLNNMGDTNMAPDSWLAQLMWQHFPPCYWILMNALPNVAKYYGPMLPPIPQNTKPQV